MIMEANNIPVYYPIGYDVFLNGNLVHEVRNKDRDESIRLALKFCEIHEAYGKVTLKRIGEIDVNWMELFVKNPSLHTSIEEIDKETSCKSE